MRTSELIDLLEKHKDTHGDTYVSVRHLTTHEFGPDDDLTDISTKYDENNNLFVIQAKN